MSLRGLDAIHELRGLLESWQGNGPHRTFEINCTSHFANNPSGPLLQNVTGMTIQVTLKQECFTPWVETQYIRRDDDVDDDVDHDTCEVALTLVKRALSNWKERRPNCE